MKDILQQLQSILPNSAAPILSPHAFLIPFNIAFFTAFWKLYFKEKAKCGVFLKQFAYFKRFAQRIEEYNFIIKLLFSPTLLQVFGKKPLLCNHTNYPMIQFHHLLFLDKACAVLLQKGQFATFPRGEYTGNRKIQKMRCVKW